MLPSRGFAPKPAAQRFVDEQEIMLKNMMSAPIAHLDVQMSSKKAQPPTYLSTLPRLLSPPMPITRCSPTRPLVPSPPLPFRPPATNGAHIYPIPRRSIG